MNIYLNDLEDALASHGILFTQYHNSNPFFSQVQWMVSYKQMTANTLYVCQDLTRGKTAIVLENKVTLLSNCTPEEALTKILEYLQFYQSRESKMIDHILKQDSLLKFLNTAEELFGCPLFLVDASNRLLEYSAGATSALPQISNYLRYYDQLKPLEHQITSNVTDFSDTIPGEENHILSSRLWHGSRYLGRICIYHYCAPVREGVLSKLETVMKYLNILLTITTQQYFATSYISSALRDICSGHFTDWSTLKSELCTSSWHASHSLRILSVGSCNDSTQLNEIQDSLLNLNLPCYLFCDDTRIVILGNETIQPGLVRILQNVIHRMDIPLHIGVSGIVDSLENIPHYLRQSDFAMKLAKHRGNTMEIAQHSAFIVYREILKQEKQHRSWVHPDLIALRKYDQENGTQLLPTLSVYLVSGCSYDQTAHTLKLHPNTIRYRIRKATELIAHNIYDPQDRENLLASLALIP